MKQLKRVFLVVLALMLAIAPMAMAAETALKDTVWQVNTSIGKTKASTIIRFRDTEMDIRAGGMAGKYTYDDKTGKLSMTVAETQNIMGVNVEAGMTVEAAAKFNKKSTILTLSGMKLKAQITPKGLFDGITLPITMKLTKLAPKVTKVSAPKVALGQESTVTIKANAAAEWFEAYDNTGKVIASGAVVNGTGTFKHVFAAKSNKITVKVGLVDEAGKLLPTTLTKAKKATIKTK